MKQRKFFWALMALGFFVGILSMPKEEYIADPMAVRCETVSLINDGSLAIPAALAQSFGERGQFFVENVTKVKWYCKYGILNSLMYLPALFIQKWHEGTLSYTSPSRVIYLNLFNLLLALASAIYLFLIASRYTKREFVAFFYVIAAFYTTYWWNYLRGQNSEIYQVLFMLGFYYHLVRSCDGFKNQSSNSTDTANNSVVPVLVPSSISYTLSHCAPSTPRSSSVSATLKTGSRPSWNEALAGLFFSLLILTKVVYVILLPVVGLFFILVHYQKRQDQEPLFSWRSLWSLLPSFCSFGLPVALAMGIILGVNNYKFGSPFESGYGQWQESGQPVFSGHLFSGLSHFFFNPQYSIFLYFPLLLFALFGYSTFFKKFRLETALFVSIGLIILLVNAKLLTWCGGWGYGPRYLLIMLPLMSLPFLAVLDWIVGQRKKGRALFAGGFIALVLLVSLRLQMNVNALPFFVNFRLQGALASLHDPRVDLYFSRVPFGIINADLLAFKQGAPLPVLGSVEKQLSPERAEQLHQFIRSQLTSNYYFWK